MHRLFDDEKLVFTNAPKKEKLLVFKTRHSKDRLLSRELIQVPFTRIRPHYYTIHRQEIPRHPSFPSGGEIRAQYAEIPWKFRCNEVLQWRRRKSITGVVNLPIFTADDEHRPLVVGATLDAHGVQSADLFALAFVNWLRMFVFVAEEGPHFHHSCRGERQHDVVFARGGPQHLRTCISGLEFSIPTLFWTVLLFTISNCS